MEYGFRDNPPVSRWIIHFAEIVVAVLFVSDRVGRFLLAGANWKRYANKHRLELSLIIILTIAVLDASRDGGGVFGITSGAITIAQIYIVLVLLLGAAGLNQWAADSGIRPTILLLMSFGVICLIGSGLLMLPAANAAPSASVLYSDALFTSVSATCVTGLITRDTSTAWTGFGQGVILVLIQLGGLGIMLFGTLVSLAVGRGLSARGSSAISEMVAVRGIGELKRVMKFVILVTVSLEVLGAISLYPMYISARDASGLAIFTTGDALWNSIFHSISAFCNAGFSLHSENLRAGEQWIKPLRDHWQVLGVFGPLIILGGLGFPVLKDTASYIKSVLGRRFGVKSLATTRARLSLQSKIVLTSTACLLVIVTIGILAFSSGSVSLQDAIFQSISTRTAGFNTIDVASLPAGAKAWMCLGMIIGGSPGGTAGGMKTVTVVLLLLTTISVLRRREQTEIFKRSISAEIIHKAIALGVLFISLTIATTFALCAVMGDKIPFIDLAFESCSACGTVGLSTGVTKLLTTAGKFVIMPAMFIGRLGPMTLFVALTSKLKPANYSYAPESLTIG